MQQNVSPLQLFATLFDSLVDRVIFVFGLIGAAIVLTRFISWRLATWAF